MRNKQLIVAIIGGVFVIIGAVVAFVLVYSHTEHDVPVILLNKQTQERISGRIYVDGSKNAIVIDPNVVQVTVPLKRGRHEIIAESYGYYPKKEEIERLVKPISIYLEQWGDELIPLSFVGWQSWNSNINISRGASSNECIVNSNSKITGGFFNDTVTTAMRGRILVLFFANTDESEYSGNRLAKLTYNQDDITLIPVDPSSLLFGEYLPGEDTPTTRGIEFLIPDDFDGKLGFVFYQAELNNLRITAYYR